MQNVPLDYTDRATEAFFDAVQEMQSGGAASFRVEQVTDTQVRVPAGAGHDQASVSLSGKYRWNTAPVTANLAAGPAGTYIAYATAPDDVDILDYGPGPPGRDYSFGLSIPAIGGIPATELYRPAAELVWDGGKITEVRQLIGPTRSTDPLTPTAPNAGVPALRVRGAAGQTSDILRVERFGVATPALAVAADGTTTATGILRVSEPLSTDQALGVRATANAVDRLAISAAGTIALSDGASAADTTLYRSAVGTLRTDGALYVAGTITVAGALNANGNAVGVLGTSPRLSLTDSDNANKAFFLIGDAGVLDVREDTTGGANTRARFGGTGKTTFSIQPSAPGTNVGLTIGGDTAAYRAAAGVLATDGTLRVGATSPQLVDVVPGAGAPDAASLQFGDKTGYRLNFTPRTGVNAGFRSLSIYDDGKVEWSGDTSLTRTAAGVLQTPGDLRAVTALRTDGVVAPASTARLRLQGGPGGGGQVEVWERMSLSAAHAFGSFPDPGAGGLYASGVLQSAGAATSYLGTTAQIVCGNASGVATIYMGASQDATIQRLGTGLIGVQEMRAANFVRVQDASPNAVITGYDGALSVAGPALSFGSAYDSVLRRKGISNLETPGAFTIGGTLDHDGTAVGFYGGAPIAKQAKPTTLTEVIAVLANLGLTT